MFLYHAQDITHTHVLDTLYEAFKNIKKAARIYGLSTFVWTSVALFSSATHIT